MADVPSSSIALRPRTRAFTRENPTETEPEPQVERDSRWDHSIYGYITDLGPLRKATALRQYNAEYCTTGGKTMDNMDGHFVPRIILKDNPDASRDMFGNPWKVLESHCSDILESDVQKFGFSIRGWVGYQVYKDPKISSENMLRDFEVRHVLEPVQNIVDHIMSNTEARRLFISDKEDDYKKLHFLDHTNHPRKVNQNRNPRENFNHPNDFFIYTSYSNKSRKCEVKVVIEFKPPHKYLRAEIKTALKQDITFEPQNDEPFTHADQQNAVPSQLASNEAKRGTIEKVTVPLIQLYHGMIKQNCAFGILITGEYYVFVRISTTEPTEDIPRTHHQLHTFCFDPKNKNPPKVADEALWEHPSYTPVSLITAFVLKALEQKPLPPPEQRLLLELQRVPLSPASSPGGIEDASQSFIPSRFLDSPHSGSPPSESYNFEGDPDIFTGHTHIPITDRQYCTHDCLKGIILGQPPDRTCPNRVQHQAAHILHDELLGYIRVQIAKDRTSHADIVELGLGGAHGQMFKIRLSSHGYTMMAKAAHDQESLEHLQAELANYDRLQQLQGTLLPVCLGIVSVRRAWFSSGVEYTHFLLLSYGGVSLDHLLPENDCAPSTSLPVRPAPQDATIAKKAEEALLRFHSKGWLHNDVAPRNFLFDAYSSHCMMIDLAKAQQLNTNQTSSQPGREPLRPVARNSRPPSTSQPTRSVSRRQQELKTFRHHMKEWLKGRLIYDA